MGETLHPELLLESGDATVVLATAFSQKLTKGIYNFSLRLTRRSHERYGSGTTQGYLGRLATARQRGWRES
jgi:hypothetical protein